ncbi:hypothetical protein H2203_008205 [Taxawa tesnikishii (nom. ined.)]|nr:hypothetical protein H2203_008205 [Dothideales sp. JES 119]
MANHPAPTLTIKLSLTSGPYRRSSSESSKPYLMVTTTLFTPSTLTLELRGKFDSGTVLEESFRAEHLSFHSLTTDQPVVYTPFTDTCDTQQSLY